MRTLTIPYCISVGFMMVSLDLLLSIRLEILLMLVTVLLQWQLCLSGIYLAIWIIEKGTVFGKMLRRIEALT